MPDKKLLNQLKKTNRLYAVLSSVNKMILHIKDEHKIFDEACRIAVQEGQFIMAWIGLLNEESQEVNAASWSGKIDDYLTVMRKITLKNGPEARGPSATSIKENKTVVVDDFAIDSRILPWREAAMKRGYASCIAIPIIINNKSIGAFMIYSEDTNFFTELEVRLLEDLTQNISFAIETIRTEKLVKITEAKIINQNNFIQTLTNALPGLVGHWNCDLYCTFANNAYIEWFGKKPSEMIGIHFSDFVPPETYIKNQPYIQGALKGIYQEFERSFIKTDGKLGYLFVQYVPNIRNGEVFGFFALGSDISSIKITEQENIHRAEELVRVQRERDEETLYSTSRMAALGEMASGMAHEINSPLAIITMKAYQLIRKHQSESLSAEGLLEGLNKISSTAFRIGNVVKGLSSISRNSDSDPMKKMKIDIVIEETLQLCRERFATHFITLQSDLSAVAEVEIEGKASQIMQVLLNLFNNAFDAIKPLLEKWVKIKAIKNENGVVFSVTDSGNGISEKELNKIMEPFFTTKESGKGTGLGLSISKRIIDEHNGLFYYQLNSLHTSFVIELPFSQK